MKFLTLVFSLVCSLQVHAGLITTQADQNSYNNGDIITFDVWVNDANPTLDSLSFDMNFDDTQLSFIDNSWVDSQEVFDFFAFGDAFSLASDAVAIEAFFLDGITDVVGTSFKLGELQFEAIGDLSSPTLNFAQLVNAQDIIGDTINPQAVPEPSTLMLFSLMAGCLLFRKRSKV